MRSVVLKLEGIGRRENEASNNQQSETLYIELEAASISVFRSLRCEISHRATLTELAKQRMTEAVSQIEVECAAVSKRPAARSVWIDSSGIIGVYTAHQDTDLPHAQRWQGRTCWQLESAARPKVM